jgi:hypothetical protein
MQDGVTDMWWSREGHLQAKKHREVDREATEAMMQSLPTHCRQYITKVASENCGVGTTLQAWSFQTNAQCPRCEHPEENMLHVPQCNGYKAEKIFLKSVKNIDSYLINMQTRLDLHDVIIHCLQQWRRKLPIRLQQFQGDLRKVIRQQHSIGWLDLLEGLPAKGWRRLQHQHYRHEQIKQSSWKWINDLMKQLHQMEHSQWRHQCKMKANITHPQERAGTALLHKTIENRFLLGNTSLQPGD